MRTSGSTTDAGRQFIMMICAVVLRATFKKDTDPTVWSHGHNIVGPEENLHINYIFRVTIKILFYHYSNVK